MARENAIFRPLRRAGEGREGEKRVKPKRYFDYMLLFMILFLISFGLVMIYSISAYNATKYYDDATLFVRNQAIYAVLGLVLMLIVAKFDYHWYVAKLKLHKKFQPSLLLIGYIICIALQFYVWRWGDGTNGSNRWIPIGKSFKLQPSEITKLLMVLLVAYLAYIAPKKLDHFSGFFRILFYSAPLVFLVATENLTTALIMVGVVFAVPFITSRKKGYFFLSLAAALVVGIGFIQMEGYRMGRISVWLDIENTPGGYQILQGLYALASGGWFGKGLGNSIQKLGYIPEVHTDMIFTCIVEELGIVGGLFLVAIYGVLLVRLFKVAVHAPDLLGSLIVVGVFVQIAMQAVLNIAVVTNTIPSTGIPLPFISYGGSSLVFLMIEMGFVLNVSNQIDYDAAPQQ